MNKSYDVIVVGTGVAGCFAALNLPPDKSVLIITKASLLDSDSYLAQGGICVLKDEEDYSLFFEDTMRAGHYQNNRESVETMIRSSQTVIADLMAYGVRFSCQNGELSYTREGAHQANRILHYEDITGQEITGTLLRHVIEKENIEIREHTTMIDLLCRENTCEGMILKTSTGEYEPVFAKDIILASGGIGGIYKHTTNFSHITGDSIGIALKHHIQLQNINLIQIHPTTLYSPKPGRRFLISESVRGEGALLYNKAKERFVNELLARDVLTNEIYKQMKKDKMPYVWLSMKDITKCDIRKRFPNIYRHCLMAGYDALNEYIPVVPAQHYFMGGIRVDLNSKTSMKHLYAVGETCCNGVHGANRLASNSLLESLVFAKRAARTIADNQQASEGRKIESLSSKKLEDVYGVDWNTYDHIDSYFSSLMENIRGEIEKKSRKELHNEWNYNHFKCG